MLDRFVEKFIVVEALYSHSGEKKPINFDINDHPKFKHKICHIVVENEPGGIIHHQPDDPMSYADKRNNSIKRIACQRNAAMQALTDASEEDFILYSDNDEIPNLADIDLNNYKRKIVVFKQHLCYYNFNLTLSHVPGMAPKDAKRNIYIPSTGYGKQNQSVTQRSGSIRNSRKPNTAT